MKKNNCWEFMKCGREQGGILTAELGVCPASVERGLEGVHGGRNAGRSCWVVAGTFCRGNVQGTFAKKYKNCRRCNFYIKVRMEEGINFRMPMVLLHMKESPLPGGGSGQQGGTAFTSELADQAVRTKT
jgi:hypothetical protein